MWRLKENEKVHIFLNIKSKEDFFFSVMEGGGKEDGEQDCSEVSEYILNKIRENNRRFNII